jgi:hypothetical protein
MVRYIAIVLVAVTIDSGCSTTFKGYSDIDPPRADPMLVGQSWNGTYLRQGGQLGTPDLNPSPSLSSLTKDNVFAFGAAADLARQAGQNLQASLSGKFSGVSHVDIGGVVLVDPNDARFLNIAKGDAIAVKAIYAQSYATTFDRTITLDASAQANFCHQVAILNNTTDKDACLHITFNENSHTATVAAPNTAIAARVVRFTVPTEPSTMQGTVQNRLATLGDYAVAFYSLAPNQLSTLKLDSNASQFCLDVETQNANVTGPKLHIQTSAFCPQVTQVTRVDTSGYNPQLPYGYIGFGQPIYAYLTGDDLHLLTANFDKVTFEYSGGSNPYLSTAYGPIDIREIVYRGDVIVAD